MGLPRVVISSGGPYQAKDTEIEAYHDTINVSQEYVHQPLSLVFTNGSYTASGFNWVRVFLGASGSSDQSGMPLGRLLVDENSFKGTSQVYVDMTGGLNTGVNPIYVQGAGMPGSVFSWELRSEGSPHLDALNPHVTIGGGTLTLSGSGFSLRPDENVVHLGPIALQVVVASAHSIKVRIPGGFPAGDYNLTASVRGYPSNLLRIAVLPVPEVLSIDTQVVAPGQILNIRGKNFSTNPQDIVVYFGPARAQVTGCSQNAVSVEIPDLSNGSAPITMFVRGIKAAGSVDVRISNTRR